MADVNITIQAVDKFSKTFKGAQAGLKGIGHGLKTAGATVGLATAAFFAFNAGLDAAQKKLEDIGATDAAAGIEEAQQAWTALGDTIMGSLADTGAFDAIADTLKKSAESARQLFILMQLGGQEIKKNLGLITAEEAQAQKILIVKQTQKDYENSIARSKKEQNKESGKSLDLAYAYEDALASGSARDIQRAQNALQDAAPMNRSISSAGGGVQKIVIEVNGDGEISDMLAQAFEDSQNPALDPTRGYG